MNAKIVTLKPSGKWIPIALNGGDLWDGTTFTYHTLAELTNLLGYVTIAQEEATQFILDSLTGKVK